MKTNVSQAVEEIKNEYKKEYEKDPKMYDYCCGRISNGLKLENGFLVEFEKPHLKKRFCFGAGMYASATCEEMKSAHDMVDKAENDKNYFIEENFNEAFGKYERLFKKYEEGWAIYSGAQRYNKDCKLVYLLSEHQIVHRDEEISKYTKLTETDIENLKKIIEEEKEKFLKRINTYLKKYGLSKVDAWSYIRD